MNSNWFGIIKVIEVEHLDVDGKLLWNKQNIKNILHADGEEFILKVLFTGEEVIPANYFFGLDSRFTISRENDMSDVLGNEPSSNGYTRSVSSSSGSFNITLGTGGAYESSSQILSFSASGGNWGPVRNLFLTNTSGYSGSLISTVPLNSELTVMNGQTINLRTIFSLRDC